MTSFAKILSVALALGTLVACGTSLPKSTTIDASDEADVSDGSTWGLKLTITEVTDTSIGFEVANEGPLPVSYWGLALAYPLATTQVRDGGRWRAGFVTMCGTGARLHELLPGQILESTVLRSVYGNGMLERVHLGFGRSVEWDGAFGVTGGGWLHVVSETTAEYEARAAGQK